MIAHALFFAFGILLLWGGTELVLRRVPVVAGWLRVSPLVVTVLLIAVLTSLPEFCVSLLASLRGQPSAALGNIVGSNLVTLTFVAGVCALWRPIRVAQTLRDRESCWMILSAALLLILSLDGLLSRGDGLVLLLAYIPYFHGTLIEARGERRTVTAGPSGRGIFDGALFLGGIALIVLGADWVAGRGTNIARGLGMSDLLIGVTFFAFGTSLPELAIALGAVMKNRGDITLGEIYASNIFTGLAVAGVLALVSPLEVEPLISQRDLPLLVLSGVVLQMFITSGRRFVRTEALAMIALYAVFLAAQFAGFSLSLP